MLSPNQTVNDIIVLIIFIRKYYFKYAGQHWWINIISERIKSLFPIINIDILELAMFSTYKKS